ncbi:MAG: YggS family pyridoxal phosphate-dependent enzyme [Oscillospiraceae bacterium]|jgi:pyridoxal phosphate enzyme (YggS family)|nr:YggS family pyridoxal phosphate-dependent enzyme [Oscillospiraceae bacterium]
MSIYDNVKRVREEIAGAAVKCGRSPEDILLVAASKRNSARRVREAVSAGVDALGENVARELAEKNAQGAYAGVPVHFIGHLQTNKVGGVVGVCSLIESADSERVLGAVARRAEIMGICQDVLIEINIGAEETKSGIPPGQLDSVLEYASGLSGVRVLGLMAIPPNSADVARARRYFDEMHRLFVDKERKMYDNVIMRYLSMGMSASFVEAIYSGSNMVRVGTAIFGERA